MDLDTVITWATLIVLIVVSLVEACEDADRQLPRACAQPGFRSSTSILPWPTVRTG